MESEGRRLIGPRFQCRQASKIRFALPKRRNSRRSEQCQGGGVRTAVLLSIATGSPRRECPIRRFDVGRPKTYSRQTMDQKKKVERAYVNALFNRLAKLGSAPRVLE